MTSTKKPLGNVKVLDLTHMLSGPYGGMILADLGCEVIKIEPPIKGEGTRRLLENDPNYSVNGMGAYFYTLNRNKKSVAIDLKKDEGLQIFYRLAEKADVVLSNFSAGVTKKLKIDFDTLKKINPKLLLVQSVVLVNQVQIFNVQHLIKLLRLLVAVCQSQVYQLKNLCEQVFLSEI